MNVSADEKIEQEDNKMMFLFIIVLKLYTR